MLVVTVLITSALAADGWCPPRTQQGILRGQYEHAILFGDLDSAPPPNTPCSSTNPPLREKYPTIADFDRSLEPGVGIERQVLPYVLGRGLSGMAWNSVEWLESKSPRTTGRAATKEFQREYDRLVDWRRRGGGSAGPARPEVRTP